jgi:hypothetical protein
MADRTSEYRIHTYTAAEAGLLVNSYLVEAADGVVLVDANLMMYRETVGRPAAGAPTLTDAQRAELTVVMTRFLPGAPLGRMIGLGADGVAAELAGHTGAVAA